MAILYGYGTCHLLPPVLDPWPPLFVNSVHPGRFTVAIYVTCRFAFGRLVVSDLQFRGFWFELRLEIAVMKLKGSSAKRFSKINMHEPEGGGGGGAERRYLPPSQGRSSRNPK